MSQASLPGLALELKIHILKSMDCFSSVANLSSTSRTFHGIWESNTKPICDAVLHRIIECSLEAKVLLDAQDSCQQAVVVQDLDTSQEEHGPCQRAIKRTQRMLVNADKASSVFSGCDNHMVKIKICRRLSPTERTDFIRAYYRALAMVLLSREAIPETLIASWDMLDLQRVLAVLLFMDRMRSRPRDLPRPRMEMNEEERLLFEEDLDTFSVMHRLENLIRRLAPSDSLAVPSGMQCYNFIAHEQFMRVKIGSREGPRGPQLAQSLPLLPEGILRDIDEQRLWAIVRQ